MGGLTLYFGDIMLAYGMKLMQEFKSAVLFDVDNKIIGFIRLDTALQIVKQHIEDEYRYVARVRYYKGVYPTIRSITYFFDIQEPLIIPKKHFLNPKSLTMG